MSLTSKDECPCCGAKIVMKKDGNNFKCPVCSCQFIHNRKKWIIAIPAVVILAILIYKLTNMPHLGIPISVIIVLFATSWLPQYRVVVKGKEDVLIDEIEKHDPKIKESKWLIGLLLLVIIFVLSILVFSLV